MYQEIILEHYRRPLHAGLREPFDAQVQHINPTCGDEVTLRVSLKDAGGEPVVADVSYEALGCSISQASASVHGRHDHRQDRWARPWHISDEFLRADAVARRGRAGRGRARRRGGFRGVSKYPARIKCALLGWMAWKDATARALGERGRGQQHDRRQQTSEDPRQRSEDWRAR